MTQVKRGSTKQKFTDWIRKTGRLSWHAEKPKIMQAYNKDFSESLLSEADVKHIVDLIIARDREVAAARACRQMSLDDIAVSAVRTALKSVRARDETKARRKPRKIRTAEERQRYAEKRRRRAFIAKIGILPAKILRNTCYSTCIQAVLACIAWEAINTGFCQKPVALLAANAAVSRRSVQMALRRAAEDGLIVVVRRTRMPNRVIVVDESWNRWIRTWIYIQSKKDNNYGDSYRGAETCTHGSERRATSTSRALAADYWPLPRQHREQANADDQCAGALEEPPIIAGLAPSALEECLATLGMLVLADNRPGPRVDRLSPG